jgi:uncharacterized membrane protein YfcA
MSFYISLILISIVVGALVGGVGVGGFFMPPALMLIANVSIQQGVATSLFTFIFTGIVGTLYFHKKGSINWALVKPVCFGAALTGFAGAWSASKLSTSALSIVLAVVIMIAGIYTLANGGEKAKAKAASTLAKVSKQQWIMLAAVGAATGFLSGLTGIGGSLLAVPLMVLCGFSLMSSIGAGQVLQIVGAVSGTVVNLKLGSIDLGLASFITVFEICGVLLGAYAIHRIDIELIRKFVGTLCLVAGCAFVIRTF